MAILRILHAGSSLRREMKGVNAAVFYTPLQAPPPVTSTTTTAATSPVPQATNAVCPAFEAQLYTTGSLQYTIHCGFVPSSYKLLGHSSDGAGSAPYDTPYNDDINGETWMTWRAAWTLVHPSRIAMESIGVQRRRYVRTSRFLQARASEISRPTAWILLYSKSKVGPGPSGARIGCWDAEQMLVRVFARSEDKACIPWTRIAGVPVDRLG